MLVYWDTSHSLKWETELGVNTHTHTDRHTHTHTHTDRQTDRHTHTHTHTHHTHTDRDTTHNTHTHHTHTHHIQTETHTHTHVGFYGLRGLSIGIMVFILYKLYVLLPYTYPTPKLSPHRRLCISIFPQKNSLCMIYKRFKLWGHWKCPHKSPSPCNTYVIPCHYTNLCPHKPHKHAHTHTHTHTHTQITHQPKLIFHSLEILYIYIHTCIHIGLGSVKLTDWKKKTFNYGTIHLPKVTGNFYFK